MRLIKIGALVALYLAAVVAANLLVTHFGPSSAPYIAFGLIGGVLIFRDQFSDAIGVRPGNVWNPRLVAVQVALIAAGAILTFLLNQNAAQIAKASVIAFAASEVIEGAVYLGLRHRPWMDRAPISATCGAAVDSVLFISIAFGFAFPIVFGQFVAKTAGGWFWARLIGLRKREVLSRDSQTELA